MDFVNSFEIKMKTAIRGKIPLHTKIDGGRRKNLH